MSKPSASTTAQLESVDNGAAASPPAPVPLLVPPESDQRPSSRYGRLLLLTALLAGHLYSVFTLLPWAMLASNEPLLGADHPAHAYRVEMYRSAVSHGGFPWGYDPALAAGTVHRPSTDAGAKPQQLLGLILFFLDGATVVKLFAVFAALSLPLWVVLACRSLGLSKDDRLWVLVLLLVGTWLYRSFAGMIAVGMSAFALASYVAPLALVLFYQYVRQPTRSKYVAAVAGLAACGLIHVLGPVLIAPSVLFLAWWRSPRQWQPVLKAFSIPIVALALNAFWLIPFAADYFLTPAPPAIPPARQFGPDLTYTTWNELVSRITFTRAFAAGAGIAFGAYGLWLMRRQLGVRIAVAFAFAISLGLFLKLFGSFIPSITPMQPARFILGTFVLLTIPVGMALRDITARLRVPQPAMGGLVVALAILVAARPSLADFFSGAPQQRTNFAGFTERSKPVFLQLPNTMPRPTRMKSLTDFVLRRTRPDDRLLVQTRVQCEQLVFTRYWNREVLGNVYPYPHDAGNFTQDVLWGKRLENWTPEALRTVAKRWGVSWAFTCTESARRLFAQICPDDGEPVGPYWAFRLSPPVGKFLIGRGTLKAEINSLNLADLKPVNGLVVLRYRYHPAWAAPKGVEILRYPVPEDPVGLIALRNPPAHVWLTFEPTAVFTAPWSGRLSSSP